MKYCFITSSCLALMLTLTACGKKAQENDPQTDNTIQPTQGELYFNALKDIEKAVNDDDLTTLKKTVLSNPGIDLNQILNDGETFLIKSIKLNYVDIRNYLLEKNCNIERATVNKVTPLMMAVTKNDVNSVKVLLDLKAELNKKNTDGDTALHIALKNRNEEIALLLIKQGANLELTDGSDKNAYKLAEEANLNNAVDLIRSILQVEYGAPDVANFRNILLQGDYGTLKTVIGRYPQIANDYEAINPLAILVDVKNENAAMKSAELLIDNHANVNGPQDAELTPLIKATITEKKNFAHLYLTANANPQLLDKDGKSALIHAIELNNPELVDLLLSYSSVEKYTFRKDGKKITYSSCKIAEDVEKTLKTTEDKSKNKAIRDSLDCGFMGFLRGLF